MIQQVTEPYKKGSKTHINEFFKIGISAENPQKRLSSLQTGNPYYLQWDVQSDCFEGDAVPSKRDAWKAEQEIHRVLRKLDGDSARELWKPMGTLESKDEDVIVILSNKSPWGFEDKLPRKCGDGQYGQARRGGTEWFRLRVRKDDNDDLRGLARYLVKHAARLHVNLADFEVSARAWVENANDCLGEECRLDDPSP